jgi:hypothetical protein
MGHVVESRAASGNRHGPPLRFEDVRLGQRLDTVIAEGSSTLEEWVRTLVLDWSGSSAAQIMSCAPGEIERNDLFIGRVIARHLDGSRQVAVEICRASPFSPEFAIVRVALA